MLKKRFGQHFLSDPRILQRIVQFANVGPDATVVEIGPGAGALTRELAAVAQRVIAVEIDRDLIPQLRENLPTNVEIVEGDALQLDLKRWPAPISSGRKSPVQHRDTAVQKIHRNPSFDRQRHRDDPKGSRGTDHRETRR